MSTQSESERGHDVIVVGGGMGGLAAAIALGAAGRRVLLLERATVVGGKVGEIVVDGVVCDTGPSILTLPEVVDDVLRHAGMSVAEHLPLVRPTPSFRYRFSSGQTVDVEVELADTLRNVEGSLGVEAARELQGFLRYAESIWKTSKDDFVFGAAPGAATLARLALTRPIDMLKVDPLRSMRQAIRAQIKSPELRALLLRYATYNGSDPTTAPATLNCIAWVELGLGGFGVAGGMGALRDTLLRAATKVGVVVHTGVAVDGVVVVDGRVVGVRVGDEVINAAAVVVNADVGWLRGQPGIARALPKPSSPSMSGATMIIKARRRAGRVAHEVVMAEAPKGADPSATLLEEFADIFARRRAPQRPTIYVCAQEQAHGRSGWADHEPLFAMINLPALAADAVDTEPDGVEVLESAAARLRTLGVIDDDDAIVWRRGPHELARRFPGSQGSLYGAASNDRLSAFRRPANVVAGLAGLYLASGSAHPGGGVPLCLQSGLLAAQGVLTAQIDLG